MLESRCDGGGIQLLRDGERGNGGLGASLRIAGDELVRRDDGRGDDGSIRAIDLMRVRRQVAAFDRVPVAASRRVFRVELALVDRAADAKDHDAVG